MEEHILKIQGTIPRHCRSVEDAIYEALSLSHCIRLILGRPIIMLRTVADIPLDEVSFQPVPRSEFKRRIELLNTLRPKPIVLAHVLNLPGRPLVSEVEFIQRGCEYAISCVGDIKEAMEKLVDEF